MSEDIELVYVVSICHVHARTWSQLITMCHNTTP